MSDQTPDEKTVELTSPETEPENLSQERPQPDNPSNGTIETPSVEPDAGPDTAPFEPAATLPPSEDEEAAPGSEETAEKPAEPAPKPANLRWDSYFLLLLIGITLVRFAYLHIVPLDLGPDESYYWDWSRHLDFGYFSKPPLIAWVNALSTALLGISPQAVRMPAVVFGAFGIIGLYLCGRRMFNAEVAFWGVAAWLATPGTAALGLIMATDVLLIFCWCLALYTLWRALENPQAKLHWWLATMVLVGLGSLGKQMMLVFPPLLIIFLLLSKEDRGHLKQRWPWLLWGGSLLFLLPPLWWNFRHHWITFKHTAHHIEPIGKTLSDHLQTFGEFVAGQLGLLTPVTWLLLALLVVMLLTQPWRWSRQTRFLFVFGAVGLLGFVGLSFKQSINPNWPATFYPALLLLLAAWARRQVDAGLLDRLRKWFIPGLKIGVALTLIAYLLPFVMELSFLHLGNNDPTHRIKGWHQLGHQVAAVLQEQPQPQKTFILSPLRKYPSELAFYLPDHPRTYQWPGNPPAVSSQYELWPGPVDKLGWDALIIHNADTPLPADLVAAFGKIVDLGERSIPIGAAGERKYHLWRGENLQIWPEAE